MHILMLLEVAFPPDERVEKEAISLIQAGHSVDLACYSKLGAKKVENYKGITIYRKEISPFLLKSSAAALVLPFYFNFWRPFIRKLLQQNQYDAIHVHDLPLTRVAYKFCRQYKLKLICDQHEYYSNWIEHTAHLQSFLGKFILTFSNWRGYEKKYLSKANLVVTVEEPLRQNYIENACVNSEDIIVVPNTPSTQNFNSKNIKSEITEKYKDQFVLFYAGGLDKLRGLDIVIKALPILKLKIPNIKFVFGGKLNKGFDILGLIKEYDVEDIVEYHSWIDYQDFPSYLSVCKIGFFTPPGNRDEIHNTIATKIYQYLLMKVPVIVSNVRMMKNFVLDHGLGLVAENEIEFADAIIELYSNPSKLAEFVNNCERIHHKYTWENTIKTLIEKYQNL